MSAADKDGRGMDYLRPFLPGLESVLEDEDVSEIMINGPGNVWVESRGEIRAHPAPGLDRGRARSGGYSDRAAPGPSIPPQHPFSMRAWMTAPVWRSVSPRPRHTSPSPSGDSASEAIRPRISCASARCPSKSWTRRGPRSWVGGISSLAAGPDRVRPRCSMPWSSCSQPTTAIVSIEDTLELRIDRKNCVRFEARGIDGESVTIRDLVKHALRHRPDHIVVGEVRGGEAADLLQALNTGHGGSLTTIHANNAESALSRLATCAMQGETDLPWEVTCRGVVDGISMVIHMTRREGRRYVEEALHVGDYDAAKRRWHYRPVAFADPQLELKQVR